MRDLTARRLPPILTLRHLAHETDATYACLRLVVSRSGIASRYRSFRIVKRSGGIRRIFVPNMELQSVLRWIHDEILSRVEPHHRAFAFRPDRPVVDCAAEHCGARWLVKFDAENFFESIDEGQVFRFFRECGYPTLLCFELARLTTVPVAFLLASRRVSHAQEPPVAVPLDSTDLSRDAPYVIDAYDFAERGVLGQGLATSPALSNLVCRGLDASLQDVADELGFVFTRYADDLTFSTHRGRLKSAEIRVLRARVVAILRRHGLKENRKKFSIAGPGARRLVLGLLIDSDRPRLSRATRARLEGHLHFLLNKGVIAHAQHREFRSTDALRLHLNGLLAYVKQVDDGLYLKYADKAKAVDWPPE